MAAKILKVPMVMQMEALECGAACLAMILAFHGRWVPLEQVRADCGVSRDGSRADNIVAAAEKYGLKGTGYSYSLVGIRTAKLPCILFWNFKHFVVLRGFRGNYAYLNDPARGAIRVTMEEFDRSFTGIAIRFAPTDEFVPGGEPTRMLGFVRDRLKGLTVPIVIMAITSAIAAGIGILNAGFSRIFLDGILTGTNPGWLLPLVIVMLLVTAIQCGISFINAISVLRIQGKLDIVSSSRFMWHLLHLPMEFYEQRQVGDLQQRQASNEGIAYTLVSQLAPVALNIVLLVFYLVVMFRYSVVLSLVGITTIFINMALMRVIANKRVNISRVQMRDSGKLYSTTISGISMIESIKASGAENGFFERWGGYQASVNNARVRYTKVSQYLGAVPGIVSQLANIIVLVLGTWLIMSGEFTVGMLLAFQGFLSGLLVPVNSLIGLGQGVQEMRTSMERIEDVMGYPEDALGAPLPADVPADSCPADALGGSRSENALGSPLSADSAKELHKLSGRIDITHVTFGYSRLDEPVIKDFSLSMEPGSWVALVGSSGCCKSTIGKLVAGLYRPWEGQICFDGMPLESIPRPVLTSSLAVVDQDIVLFDDTVNDNIKFWNRSIDNRTVVDAARDVDLDADIMARDGGYESRVLPGGCNFSGGQRQRLEIARMLAAGPSIVIFDEATSALDAKTEQKVIESIRARGVTCIVVAHRLSTVRDCDEIVVLDAGAVVERGTHEELMAADGRYAALIRSN